MKTLNEWLESGMLTGLAESDYHEVVVLFNRILYHADSAAFKTKVIPIESFIIPLIRRVYDELKTISIREADDGVVLKNLVKHMDAYEILTILYSKSDLITLMKIALPNLDSEVEGIRLIAEDIAGQYYKNYKNLKEAQSEHILQSFNPSFKLWNQINKKNQTIETNETETTTEVPF